MSTALQTDRYEFSMLEAFIKSGKVNEPATFEVFTRKLPAGRRYGVFAGVGRLRELLKNFHFDQDEAEWMVDQGIISSEVYSYLRHFEFKGEIYSYAEGNLFFPNSPVLQVSGTLGECILLETLILSVLNFDSAIATTASRMVSSAKGRPVIEMGSRRVNEDAAVAAARAAYIAGFASTSNVHAGRKFNIPTTGTAAHAFTLAYATEKEAFEAQIDTFGPDTTLLIDTYDIEQGIRNAVEIGGTSLRGIRIDSGDLAYEATRARHLLDHLGAYGTKIIVTSDLDEFIMKDLQEAPIDGYGVGTKLVSSAPMGFVYKLVEISGRPVAKKAKDKVSIGGAKIPFRMHDESGKMTGEFFVRDTLDVPEGATPLYNRLDFQYMNLDRIRSNHKAWKGELPLGEQKVWNGDFGPLFICEEWRD